MRKKYIPAAFLLAATAILLQECADMFTTTFDRIDPDAIRVLSFMYEPVDIAPGDTVTATAVFSGRKITTQDIDWKISFNVVYSIYGSATVSDIQPIPYITPPEQFPFSKKTSAIRFKFVVPDSILYTSSQLSDIWISQHIGDLPGSSFSKTQVLNMLYSIDHMVPESGGAFYRTDPFIDTLKKYAPFLPALLQLFTVKIRLIADISGAYRVNSECSVRYNRHFAKFMSLLPELRIYANTNPVIDSIGIYTVSGKNLQVFDTSTNKAYTFTRLHGPADNGTLPDSLADSIIADGDHSYFIAAFTSRVDSALTLSNLVNGKPFAEQHRAQFYFGLDSTEAQGVSPYDFMNIVNFSGNTITPLYTPKDTRISKFTIWLEVYDNMLNVLFRPQGTALMEVHGRFVYK